MALHLNLYHEIQTQNLQRKRDPLRLGMLGLLVVAIGFVSYYFYRLDRFNGLNNQASRAESDWATLEPKQKQAEQREKELQKNISLRDELVKRMEERCLWGPLLDTLSGGVPRQVQVTKFEAGREDKSRAVTFTIEGLASGVQARKTAEEFRMSFLRRLTENFKGPVNSVPKDGFRTLEDREERVVLAGQSYATASFVVSYEAAMDVPAPPASTPAVRHKIPK